MGGAGRRVPQRNPRAGAGVQAPAHATHQRRARGRAAGPAPAGAVSGGPGAPQERAVAAGPRGRRQRRGLVLRHADGAL